MEELQKNYKSYLMLQILIAVYSLSSVCSKFASYQKFLSVKFIFFYGAVLFLLAIYAVVWQQLLKTLPLVTAYANKSITVIWGLIWGMLFFREKITVGKVLGCIIIIIGVCLMVTEKEKEA